MKSYYHIFCGILVLLLLVVGSISLFDRDATESVIQERQLKTFPKFTFSGFITGAFMDELEAYYADTFPGREALLEGDSIVSNLFDFSDIVFAEAE